MKLILTEEELKALNDYMLSLAIKPNIKTVKYKLLKRDKDGTPHIHFFIKIEHNNVVFNTEFFEE